MTQKVLTLRKGVFPEMLILALIGNKFNHLAETDPSHNNSPLIVT
jgi:hypothetical protein